MLFDRLWHAITHPEIVPWCPGWALTHAENPNYWAPFSSIPSDHHTKQLILPSTGVSTQQYHAGVKTHIFSDQILGGCRIKGQSMSNCQWGPWRERDPLTLQSWLFLDLGRWHAGPAYGGLHTSVTQSQACQSQWIWLHHWDWGSSWYDARSLLFNGEWMASKEKLGQYVRRRGRSSLWGLFYFRF